VVILASPNHFSINKTIDILEEHFYSPKMASDVDKVISKCSISHRTKRTFDQGLYTPLPTLNGPWENVSMDFILVYQAPKGSMAQSWLWFMILQDDILHFVSQE